MREWVRRILIWAAIIFILAIMGRFLFNMDWWLAIVGGAIALIGNALLIEWEDRQPGGWSE